MNVYMALAPPWAQILPQPPPAAKFTMIAIRFDQRTLEASGQLGARISTTRREQKSRPGDRAGYQEGGTQ